MKKTIAILMVICMLFSISACNNDSKAKIEDNQTIKLSETEITLPIGETTPLLIETTPEDIKDKITWKSSDENIAKYFGGEVLAKNKGTCEITATTPNGFSATCKIIVSAKIIDSGPCGENVTWTYYEDFTLVISGSGEIYEYSNGSKHGKAVPWIRHKQFIKHVEIEEGITNISKNLFLACPFNTISLPSSITSIGYHSFTMANNYDMIVIPKSVKSIGAAAFSQTSPDIYYESSESDFYSITETEIIQGVQTNWDVGFNGKVLYYSETQKEGYWRYVDGVPTAW